MSKQTREKRIPKKLLPINACTWEDSMTKMMSFGLWILLAYGGISPAFAQVPEIPNPQLNDIAMVTVDGNGNPIIFYNPNICAQIGPYLCGFYRTHEYCHIRLGHTIRQMWPQQRELEADCCAAQMASIQEVQAAYQWFMSGGGSGPVHGLGWQRAQRIQACRN